MTQVALNTAMCTHFAWERSRVRRDDVNGNQDIGKSARAMSHFSTSLWRESGAESVHLAFIRDRVSCM